MPLRTGTMTEAMIAETLAGTGARRLWQGGTHAGIDAAARKTGTDAKIIAYCLSHTDAGLARDGLARQKRLFVVAALIGMFVAALLGATAGRGAISADGGAINGTGAANFIWLLGVVLVPHFLALLGWLTVMALGGRVASLPGLGRVLAWFGRKLGQSASGTAIDGAARRTIAGRLTRGPGGRWTLSSASHALWLAFLTGALLSWVITLSTRQYLFIWETTILREVAVGSALKTLAAAPAALGFAVPDSAMIAAARTSGSGDMPPATDAPVWASYLIGSVIVYGIIPRLVLFVLCFALAARALRHPRLDLSDPAFADIVPHLAPLLRSRMIVDPDDMVDRTSPPALDRALTSARSDPPAPSPNGAVAILGWEITEPEAGWPPPGLAQGVHDLGLIDGRQALAQALNDLGQAIGNRKFARLIVVVDMATAPDRGVEAALRHMTEYAGGNVVLVLTNESGVTTRLGAGDTETRIRDWVSAAHRAGVQLPDITTVDLAAQEPDLRAKMAHLSRQADG